MSLSELGNLVVALGYWVIALFEFYNGYEHLRESNLEIIGIFIILLFLRYIVIYRIGLESMRHNQRSEIARSRPLLRPYLIEPLYLIGEI